MSQKSLKEIFESLEGIDTNSAEYKEFVASVLRRIDPRAPFGTELYKEIAKVSWNCYWESVALRFNENMGKLEVFMIKRDDTDPDWSGHWHVPGTALRPGDNEIAPERRLVKEYGLPIILIRVGDVGFGWHKLGDEGRGPGVSFVFLTFLESPPKTSSTRGWFPVNDLPVPTVPEHVNAVIPLAVTKFRGHNL